MCGLAPCLRKQSPLSPIICVWLDQAVPGDGAVPGGRLSHRDGEVPGGRLSHGDGAVPGGRLSQGHGAVPGGRLSHSPSFGPLLSDSVHCLFQWTFQPTNRVQIRFAQIQPDTFLPRWPSSEPKEHSQSSQVLFCALLNWHKVRHGQPVHQPLSGHSIQFSELQVTQDQILNVTGLQRR